MTEHDIILALARPLDHRKYPFILFNAFIYAWECDFWVLDTKGVAREYEIKISMADFKKDAAKGKHADTTKGANYFYYVCPEGLIQPDQIPAKYGLIHIDKHAVPHIIKKPTLLHDKKYDNYRYIALKYMWKWKDLWFKLYWDKKGITTDEYYDGFITDGK